MKLSIVHSKGTEGEGQLSLEDRVSTLFPQNLSPHKRPIIVIHGNDP